MSRTGSVSGPAAGPTGTAAPPRSLGGGGPVGVHVPVVYSAPLRPLRVVRAFRAPLTRYGPGHRGVDLAAVSTALVHSAAAGVVTFAGTVAGRGVVVVAHADGVRTEYEPLRVLVHRGDSVTSTSALGRVREVHAACGDCLHWGARLGGEYFDPLSLLAPLGPVRLVPWSGR